MKILLLMSLSFLSLIASSNDAYLTTLESVLENDPEYIEIQSQKAYQEVLYKESLSKLVLPSIDLTFSKTDEKAKLGDNSYNSEQGGLNFSLSLFKFGSDYANLRSSRLALDSFQSQLKVNLIAREKVITNTLLEYTSRSQILIIQQEIQKIKKNIFKISKQRFRKGALSRDNLSLVEIDYLNSNSETIITKQKLLELKNKLSALGVNDFDKLMLYPWNKKFTATSVSKILAHKSPIESTPQIQRLQKRAKSKELQVARVKRSHFGEVTFDYSRTYTDTEDTESRFGQQASLNFVIPIFEKYSKQTRLELARSEARTAKAYYLFEMNKRKSVSEGLRRRLELSFENLKLRKKTLSGAKSLFKNSTKQFRKGLLSANELLLEQDRYLTTKLLTNSATLAMHLDYMNLIHFYGLAITDKYKF